MAAQAPPEIQGSLIAAGMLDVANPQVALEPGDRVVAGSGCRKWLQEMVAGSPTRNQKWAYKTYDATGATFHMVPLHLVFGRRQRAAANTATFRLTTMFLNSACKMVLSSVHVHSLLFIAVDKHRPFHCLPQVNDVIDD
jgi:hypothetical protein